MLQEKLANWPGRSAGVHSTYSLPGEQELHVIGDTLILPPPDWGIEPLACGASALTSKLPGRASKCKTLPATSFSCSYLIVTVINVDSIRENGPLGGILV